MAGRWVSRYGIWAGLAVGMTVGFLAAWLVREVWARVTYSVMAHKSRDEVVELFDRKFPFRMREVEVMIGHGYQFEVDEVAGLIHWTKP